MYDYYPYNKVLGYFRYNIDKDSNAAYAMQIMNFYQPSIIFANDLKQFLTDIFEKFQFRKLRYACYIGNAIEKQYDKITQKYGGRIVGIQKEDNKLMDGKYYDCKLYEILLKDYLKNE